MKKSTGSLISFMANKVKTDGGINLAQGIPAFKPPEKLLEGLQKITFNNLHQYAQGTGNNFLLQKLEEHYNIPENRFLIVNGATEALSLLITYFFKTISGKFSILAFDPVYESYKHLPRIFNIPFVAFNLDKNNNVNFDDLEYSIKSNGVKLILLASPGNPLGKVWSKKEVDTLVDICTKNKVYLIFDAVYSDLYFDNRPYFPLHKENEYIFYVNAFSKKFSITGWRIGYLIAPELHMAAITDIHDYTGLCSPSILQQAIAEYVDVSNFGADYTKELRKKLKTNYILLSGKIKELGFRPKEAQGGYFIWTELPDGLPNGLDFALNLYEKKKVAVVPGIHFSKNGKNIIRINIARNNNEINESVKRIKEYINEIHIK
jgi:aspartate/methionine/tyrosine aminotransferase